MIYQCSTCNKTSFEIICPWCKSVAPMENGYPITSTQQVPLDPSFYPEFQYQTKGFIKDLLGKKREQIQLNDKLRSVLQNIRNSKSHTSLISSMSLRTTKMS